MKSIYFSAFVVICSVVSSRSQEQLPYYEIQEAPDHYSAGTVVSRLIDGVGFRYYWATEGLRAVDLAFKPSEEARTSRETLEHIYGLCNMVLNSALKQPNGREDVSGLEFAELRKKTLQNLKKASDIFRKNDDISDFKILYKRGDETTEIPFWNQLNGPIADALWHIGQVVSHRRTSGNPFTSNVSVFSGKVRQ